MKAVNRLRALSYTIRSASKSQVVQTLANYLRRAVYTKAYWDKYGKNSYTFTFPEWRQNRLDQWKTKHTDGPHLNIQTQDWDKLIGYPLFQERDYENELDENEKGAAILDKLLKPLGWFVKHVRKSGIWFHADLEPMQYEEAELPEYLYHFSALQNKQGILRKGLIPKKGDWGTDYRYPPRVHVLKKFDINDIRTLAHAMLNHDADPETMYRTGGDSIPLVVFRIDTQDLNPGTKFRKDHDAGNALWTYTHIPPSALSVIHEDKYDPRD